MYRLLWKRWSACLVIAVLMLCSASCSMAGRIGSGDVKAETETEKRTDKRIKTTEAKAEEAKDAEGKAVKEKDAKAQNTKERGTADTSSKAQEQNGFLLTNAPIKVNDEAGNTVISEDHIASAVIKKAGTAGEEYYKIEVSLTEEGAQIFAGFTEGNMGKCVTVLYDNMVYEQPVITAAVTGGKFQFGYMTLDEADKLSNNGISQSGQSQSGQTENGQSQSRRIRNSEDSLIDKNCFLPSSPAGWKSILSGDSKIKIYDAADGEWVKKENHDKFKINGVYVTSAYIKEDDFTYYWVNSSGNKGLGGSMELTPDYRLVNFYPGTTGLRSLESPEVTHSELYPAIVNTIFIDRFSDEFTLSPKGKWDNGLFYIYDFNTNAIGHIHMEIDNYDNRDEFVFELTMSRENENYNDRLNCVLELLEPLADLDNIVNALEMFDYSSSETQTFAVDGYYFEIKLVYVPYPHGNNLIIRNY
ncbi:hypothetical protein GPL15_04775 [Clostridium sp. MCC353]|uniref:SecDF P1 head subdomain-containing protein n=1 Tax=Clostridium sp. MCC353 TaxID=2592646 RepID=UPI001C038D45|nr:hypothetical protein [Clostridium sp. MCC353]MBT9775826.1 hypothetical protein [Clostridium sp. MCC353]